MKRWFLLACLVVLCGWINRNNWSAPFSVNVAALTSPSTVTVNSLSPTCFTNPADTVASNTNWTPASTKYLFPPSSPQFVLKSIATCAMRDVEVVTWTRQGYVYVRLDGNGQAIYFKHDGESTNGTLEIGIVTGLDESSYPGGTYYPLYSNIDLVHNIPNSAYSKTDTTGTAFTFGVQGFNIYAKFNGVQFATFQDYRQMNSGAVALKANLGGPYGFRNIAVTPTSPPTLYSKYWLSQIDLRDFGLRSIQTTGTISVSSASLALAAAQNFKINDYVVVEIGAEAGAGARGTIGVGGQWPALTFANAAAMNADVGEALNTFAWTQSDGVVYEWNGSAWSTTFNCTSCASGAYYTSKSVPMSLVARITAISTDGKTLTLDTTATATATNANVYLDDTLTLNNLTQTPRSALAAITPSNLTLIFPAGSFAFSGYTNILNHTGWTIQGQGAGSTTLLSPKGTFGAGFYTEGGPNTTIQNLTLTGNYGLNQFGLNWSTTVSPIPTSTAVTEYDPTSVNGKILTTTIGGTVTQLSTATYYQTSGITFSSSNNSTAQNLTINDVFTNAVQCQGSDNCWGKSVTVNINSAKQSYTQWLFEWNNATTGGCQNCTITATNMIQGFESFSSIGTQWISPTGTNAAFSLNDAGGWSISNATLGINTGGTLAPGWTAGQGLTQIDTNTGSDKIGVGGTITNMVITETGYLDSVNNVEVGILITSLIHDITITGGSYIGPNYTASGPPTTIGPQGIRSQGASNISVSGFTSCGTISSGAPSYGHANIGVLNGSVTNSQGAVISAPSKSGNNNTPC